MLSVLLPGLSFAGGVTICYKRYANDYDGWKLWVWNESEKRPGFDLEPSGTADCGAVFTLDLEKTGLAGKKAGILPRRGAWDAKDSPDRFYDASMPNAVYLLENDSTTYRTMPVIKPELKRAFLDSENALRLVFSAPVNGAFLARHAARLVAGAKSYGLDKLTLPAGHTSARVFNTTLDKMPEGGFDSFKLGGWRVVLKDLGEAAVSAGAVLDGDSFRSDKEMGVVRDGEKTLVRVFAPTAVNAVLLCKQALATEVKEYPMAYAGNGLWEVSLSENTDNWYYRLRVTRGGKTVEGIDPYARSVTAHNGWGMILPRELPEVAPSPVFPNSENVIYEMHIRDIDIDPKSGVRLRGKYPGVAEADTRHSDYPEMKTGLDHLSELGVNTLHIMPFQDFENDESTDTYNWGYMPVNFNSPDGWYATRQDDATRVREVREMISALHKRGFKVVMDVVYNHTAEANPDTAFNFNALAPNYYYRVKPDGTYSNGSGCGNEFRSDSYMGRKFLVDSLKYWAREYKVDGFRFDLMGLMDMPSIEAALVELKKINPNIFVYGEPWTAGETLIAKTEKGAQKGKGFAVFNDNFRNAIKGSVFNLLPGYVQTGVERARVIEGLRGSINDFTVSPQETINYVSCHDNLTLWDRLVLSTTGQASFGEQIRMDMLANGIVLAAQGLPFLHSGEEMLRTKNGEDNSYNLPDSVNRIDWTRKKTFEGVFRFYKGMVEMRLAHPAFRMETADAVRANMKFYEDIELPIKEPLIAYTLDGSAVGDTWKKIVVLINPGKTKADFTLPKGSYTAAVEDGKVDLGGLRDGISGSLRVPPISMTVLYGK